MSVIESGQIAHLIELRGVYDGWSVAVMKDGTLVNRWGDGDGPYAGYERRFNATAEAIANMQSVTP